MEPVSSPVVASSPPIIVVASAPASGVMSDRSLEHWLWMHTKPD
jgi:hypothetical protein